MKSAGLSFQELLQIIEVIRSSSQFSEVRLRSGELEIELRRSGRDEADTRTAGAADNIDGNVDSLGPPMHEQRHGHVGGGELLTELPAAPAQPEAQSVASALSVGAKAITSPMVGTFYRAPEPGAAPFVEVGQRVEPNTIVCIIEVMKLMNSIPAGCRGTVRAILVGDAQPVDTGQPLIVLDPE